MPVTVLKAHAVTVSRFVPTPAYTVEVAWGQFAQGWFYLDHSLLDGPDILPSSSFATSFRGDHDDVSGSLLGFEISRGADDALASTLSGTASVRLQDPPGMSGFFNPANAGSPIAPIRPLRPCRITGKFGGVTYPLYYGFLRRLTYESAHDAGVATLELNDLMLWLDRAKPTIADPGPTTTGSAVGLVLDAVGWTDTAMRRLDVGDLIPGFPLADGTVTALNLIAGLLETERGRFFQDAAGVAVYQDRHRRAAVLPKGTLAGSLTAVGAGVDLDLVRNRIAVTRLYIDPVSGDETQAEPQVSVEQASVDEFGWGDANPISSRYLRDDEQALSVGGYVLAFAKDPNAPLYQLRPSTATASLLRLVLGLELGDRATVAETETDTGGDYHVERISRTVDNATAVHRAEMIVTARGPQAFVLDQSLLDGHDLLLY